MKLRAAIWAMIIIVSACESTQKSSSKWSLDFLGPKKHLTQLARSIDEGGEVFLEATASFQSSSELALKEQRLVALFYTGAPYWNSAQLLRATRLYELTEKKHNFLVFSYILKSSLKEAPSLAWRMLQGGEWDEKQQQKYAAFIDNVLSEALEKGSLEKHLVPSMAEAVQKWRVESVYTILRMALFRRGEKAFAESMMRLSPQKSSKDFMHYLALTPREELRQLSFSTMKLPSILAALEHLKNHPPHFGHPKLSSLFAYGASRQPAIKKLALEIIDHLTPIQPMIMAYSLRQEPHWVQLSIIEQTARQSNARRELLLRHLSQITTDEVISEELALLKE